LDTDFRPGKSARPEIGAQTIDGRSATWARRWRAWLCDIGKGRVGDV
jgi:hypothetical protein